jgi:quercetin dioxygenase-like cupin family protein
MGFTVVRPEELAWEARPSDPGAAERHRAALSERAGLRHSRANVWRYEPGAKGRRHRDTIQDETFVVLSGTLTMYLGETPERHTTTPGGLIHVESGTPLQIVNEADEDLLLFVYGAPPEHGGAEFLESAV